MISIHSPSPQKCFWIVLEMIDVITLFTLCWILNIVNENVHNKIEQSSLFTLVTFAFHFLVLFILVPILYRLIFEEKS